ncbi:hypothetical protein LCI18_003066 [Fusarium solani-melongenae]|uniref:Uncharacterized protein n=1 Tax=Fusarium solani subsp. cucurbitae TaxID=2747967 RepID=A0ACD3YTB7_FUSSC|nr:hypothetical protein LCI18_003066 [Fusarium solani-melongenae]
MEALQRDKNRVNIVWLPSRAELKVQRIAKTSARQATEAGLRSEKTLPEGVGRHSRRVDSALPGRHTRLLYDQLSWKEASVLAQLRTGMARLNGYLYQIRAAPTDECPCGRAKETVENFLFRRKWTLNMNAVRATIRFAIATGCLAQR